MVRHAAAPAIINEPIPQLGNPASERWLRDQYKQLKWEDIEHRVKNGQILDLVYDYEATDLNTMFCAPTQFCGKIKTIDGRIIDELKLDIQVPEDVVISPQAALVTQSRPEALYSAEGRVPPHIAAGKIMLFFRNPYRALWDQLENTATHDTGAEEEVRVYTITSPNGKKKAELRLHQGGKSISCRYPDKVDNLCDMMEHINDKHLLAPAIARVLKIEEKNIFDIGNQKIDRDIIEPKIRAFDGNIDAFMDAMKKEMGPDYPPEMHQIPNVDRLPDGTNTYRDPDGKRWKKMESPAMTKGHNIKRYDDRLQWSFLHRQMSDEIFLTHTKKHHRFRVDTLDVAKLVALLDQGGEKGFKVGTKIDARTGKPYKSFTLSSLMEANTREANFERGIDEGVRMPDGSKYDRKLAHADAGYDVDATMSLEAYLRTRVPDVVRLMEINSDFDRIKPFLIGSKDFAMHPVLAFARSIYPDNASLHFGVCVNINEEIEERRQAVMIRTDTDQKLEDYTYRGKKLLDMSVDELAAMLVKQHGQPDALCEVIDLRKNPPVIPAEMAFHRGKGGDPERHEANRRFVLSNEDFCRKLIEAHSKAMPPMPDFRSIPNPQAEEHLFTGIAQPKWYEIDMGNGIKQLLVQAVHKEWADKALPLNRKIDYTLRRAIKPQPIEFEVRQDTLDAFIERMKEVDKKLEMHRETKQGCAMVDTDTAPSDDENDTETAGTGKPNRGPFKFLPQPEQPFTYPKWDIRPSRSNPKGVLHVVTEEELERLTANAREYLWKLRAELMYEFHDNITKFTVQDRHGHEIPFRDLNTMKESDVASRLSGNDSEYKIIMEELNWSRELLSRMFRDAGQIEWVKKYWAQQGRDDNVIDWEECERYLNNLRALRINGAPHLDPDQQRWMTAVKGLKEVARIRRNIRAGKDSASPEDIRATDDQWGLWDIFMRDKHNSERILNECEALYRRQLAENPLTEEKQRRLGYDPQNSGLPIEYVKYEVPADAKVITIDVPYYTIEKPLSHQSVAHKFIMINPDEAQRKALAEAEPNSYLFLRDTLGRIFLAVKPVVLSSDKIAPSHYFQELYNAADKLLEDSGMTPPTHDQYMCIAAESFEPKPSEVDLAVPSIKIPRWEDFEATVSPTLGYRDAKLTGLVIKKDSELVPTPGPVRLQGMEQDKNKPGLTESGWEVPTTITQVRTLTLRDAKDRINAGLKQHKAANILGLESIEALREALEQNRITDEQVRNLTSLPRGLNFPQGLQSLCNLMNVESFTPRDAVHYGYSSLDEMRSYITKLFVDQERDAGRDDNLIHFVDIEPADKSKMSWHRPDRRQKVKIDKDAVYFSPPPTKEQKPDASSVHGAPEVERGYIPSQHQERAY